MKRTIPCAAAVFFALLATVAGESTTEKVQKTLKDQGFYYGEVTGKVDADTTAAIRRYQIRNGLKVTGELDTETQKSLGVSAGAPSIVKSTPKPEPTATPTPAIADLRGDSRDEQQQELAPDISVAPSQVAPYPGYAPGPRGLQADTSGVFEDTPYEVAPPDLQRRVIIGAQTLLARGGYYRSDIDGDFGRGTEFALRAYQSRVGLAPTGRLDIDTLGALGLLPGQRGPGFAPTRPRFMRPPPSQYAPTGERIYTPN